jgi:lipopolysaccharide transport system permease protein
MNKNYFKQVFYCLQNFKQIFMLAFFDLKIKYRRTSIGFLWNILSLILSTFLIAYVWSFLFKVNFKWYLSYVLIGLSTWALIISCIIEGCTILYNKFRSHISNTTTPIIVYSKRNLIYNFFIYIQILPIILLFAFLSSELINLERSLLLIFGIILIYLNLFWINILLSVICSRYRDLHPFIQSISGTLTLITPIVWEKERLGTFAVYAYLNPFTSFIEVVRMPLVSDSITLVPYLLLVIFLFLGNTINYLFFKIKGNNFIFWSL